MHSLFRVLWLVHFWHWVFFKFFWQQQNVFVLSFHTLTTLHGTLIYKEKKPQGPNQRPFWRAAGFHHQPMWGNRCRRCGPRHTRASQQKASGRFRRSPPHDPLLLRGCTLRQTHTDQMHLFSTQPLFITTQYYTHDVPPRRVYSSALWSSSTLSTTWYSSQSLVSRIRTLKTSDRSSVRRVCVTVFKQELDDRANIPQHLSMGHLWLLQIWCYIYPSAKKNTSTALQSRLKDAAWTTGAWAVFLSFLKF